MITSFGKCVFEAKKIGHEFEPYPEERIVGYCTRSAALQLVAGVGLHISPKDSFVVYGGITFFIVGDPYEPPRVGCIYRDPSSKGIV